MDDIKIENGEVIKVIAEVLAVPAIPEQKIVLSREELLGELHDTADKIKSAQETVERCNIGIVPLMNRKNMAQKIVDEQTARKASIEKIIDSLPDIIGNTEK